MKRTLALHLFAAAAILGYANSFEIWRWLVASAGPASAYLPPVLAAAAGAGLLGVTAAHRRTGVSTGWRWLALALAFAVAGLWLADPQFPAKRIHVPQYFLIGLVMRAALAKAPGGWLRTLGAILLATLYGVHDEFVQGLLPERTYGLADIAVDALGAAAGALAGHALAPDRAIATPRPAPGDLAVLVLQAAILGTALAYLTALRDTILDPLWAVPFLVAGIAAFAARSWRTVLAPAGWLCAALSVHIGIGHVFALAFN
ncbi:MAG: VanZ family protein [Proteobacteria bacterium]|nr:VanZ family protein [Pseudomonadota bacterium]